MALGFGSVGLVALVMGALLLGIINDVSRLVSGMRHDEHAIRQGFELATAVREHAVHITHALLRRDQAQVDAGREWARQVRARIREVSPLVPRPDRWRARVLADITRRMHATFEKSALPAAGRGDTAEARWAYQQIESLGKAASRHADALARATESRMAHAHVLATSATRIGLLVAAACVLIVVALSVAFTLRLRAAVLKPLVILTDAARRFGRGEFRSRVGPVGRGELGALGRAFDHMAEELALREGRLVQSERMAAIGQLAAGVAHELNNPIGIIRGYLKTMSPTSEPVTLAEELAILDEEAAHCERIAADLLSYARASEMDLETIEMRSFLEETARRFRESPAATGPALEVRAEPAELEADGARIRQVVLNLLLNAAQASPPGERVLLSGAVDGQDYRILVEDRGPGVPADDRERVFEPFFSRRRGGSGLGLSVALGIVRAHRGTIAVSDAAGGGACFAVRLPLAQRSPAPAIDEATS